MRSIYLTVLLAWAVAAAGQQASQPPVLPAQPVTDIYHGQKVEDRFRFIERMEPATLAWMRAQAAYTRRELDAIGPRSALAARLSRFGDDFGFVGKVEYEGDRLFYMERPPHADQASLIVRGADGARRVLVDVPALIRSKGYPISIDGFEPSRDGRFVAVRLSEKGSENSTLTVLDVASGRTMAGPVVLGPFTDTSWDVDGQSLFFSRLPDLAVADAAKRYNNTEIAHWTFGTDPRVVVGAKAALGPNRDPEQVPQLFTPRGTGRAILVLTDGVSSEMDAWEAPIRAAAAGTAAWRRITSREDGVTALFADASGVTFLTHHEAPGYKVTHAAWTGTAATATPLLPSKAGIFYDAVRGGRDAIYVIGRERMAGAMWRVTRDGRAERLRLPQQGSVGTLEAESDRDGAVVSISGYATPLRTYAYRPTTGFTDLKLETIPPTLDLSRYAVVETEARAGDGAKVPLTILTAAGPRRPGPFLLDAYGAYGNVTLPGFYPRLLPAVDVGIGHAQCSVRGGGELGDVWRLAGKGPAKPNTWRDAIACAEKLIADGYTTPGQLAIIGASAGGIMVGRAATERPDLFAAAISQVGVSNPLRSEQTASGVSNAKEYGSVNDPQGFRNLLAMDTYQSIRDGVRLPPFLVTTGLNDPRVAPWMPAKLVARLQEAGDVALLRLDEQGGHGLGDTRSARDAELADIDAFILWHAGVRAWQPSK